MAQVRVMNDAYGVLSVPVASTDTMVVLQSGQGARFPAIATGSGDWFYITLINLAGAKEICQVTSATGDVMTVTRGVDGTTAQTFSAGSRVELRWNAATISDLQTQMRSATVAKLNQYLPVGMIAIYNGSAASIPAGWQLCDGTNGTPNLKDRIVIGAGVTATVGASGGSVTTTVTSAMMPSHNHGINEPLHNHGVTETPHTHGYSDPGHTHGFDTEEGGGSVFQLVGIYPNDPISGAVIEGTYGTSVSGTGISLNATTVSVTINTATTGITLNNAGSGTALNTMPPYFAQAYIQKVAAWV